MSKDLVSDDERVQREQALDQSEAALTASERALDARWAAQRKRGVVLGELADYAREREETLRSRALRLGLSIDDIESLMPEPEAEVLDDQLELMNAARLHLIEAREALVSERTAFLDHWREFLEAAESGHSVREEALIAHEQALAEGFRKLVILGRQGAQVEDVDDDRAWQRAVEGAFSNEKPVTKPESTPKSEEIPPPWPPSLPQVKAIPHDNRREFQRITLDADVDFGSPHNFYTGSADNISVGGLFVATRSLLPEGRTVAMRFSLPGTLRLDIEGVVSWRRLVADASGPVGLGIRFVRVPEEARDEIERFVRQRLPMRA
ncbi:MAG: PilZ domain-containing protein [Myxococcota bacterium]|nr:PilZ domain-containing protein [Myxococcota bacterium]